MSNNNSQETVVVGSTALLGFVVFLDCPFCGADGNATFDPAGGMSSLSDPPTVQVIVRSMGGVFVGCNVCGAQGPTRATRDEAINKWQVRRLPNAQSEPRDQPENSNL